MTEHTPGPWEAIELLIDGTIIWHKGYEVRTPTYDVCGFSPRGGPIRKLADARLIAAAPDLLAACEEMLDLLMCWHPGIAALNERVRTARTNAFDAIAKAKGER